MYNIASTRK